jgi:hypothetical protein
VGVFSFLLAMAIEPKIKLHEPANSQHNNTPKISRKTNPAGASTMGGYALWARILDVGCIFKLQVHCNYRLRNVTLVWVWVCVLYAHTDHLTIALYSVISVAKTKPWAAIRMAMAIAMCGLIRG